MRRCAKLAVNFGGNSRQRKILDSAVERALARAQTPPNMETTSSGEGTQPDGRWRRLFKSPITWGGVGVIFGARASSASQIGLFFIGWALLWFAFVEVRFFKKRVISGNLFGAVVILFVLYFVWRWTPQPPTIPTLDQIANASVNKIRSTFPWMASGPRQETNFITVPPVPKPQHSSIGFEPMSTPSNTTAPFKEGQSIGVNIGFRNVGDIPITTSGFGVAVDVFAFGDRDKACTELRPLVKLKYETITVQRTFGGVYTPSINLTGAQADGLNRLGDIVLCGMGVVQWKDPSGKYETHGCQCLIGAMVGSDMVYSWHATADDNREMQR